MRAPDRPAWQRLIAAAALAAALAAWTYLAVSHSLNQDEGYYARASLHVLADDPLLSRTDLDKPPLLFWLQAPGLWLFGRTELGARLVGILSCLAMLILAGRIAARLARDCGLDPESSRIASLWLLAASPYVLMLGPLGMTDAPAAVPSLLAIDAALRRKPGQAGFWVGLAWAIRQLGLLAVVVPMLILLAERRQARDGLPLRRNPRRGVKMFLLGFLAPVVPLMIWTAFAARDPFLWLFGEILGKQGMSAPATAPLDKLRHWLQVSLTFLPGRGASALGLASLVIAPMALRGEWARSLRRRLLAMAAAAAFFLAIFALWGFPRYPRFLFPVLPLAAWGLSMLWAALSSGLKKSWRGFLSAALALTCLSSLIASVVDLARPLPRDDLPELARAIAVRSSSRPAVLSRDLNRQLLFYMFGEEVDLGQWHDRPEAKLPDLLQKHEARRTWILLQRERGELDRVEEFERIVGPMRRLVEVASGENDQIRLYTIEPRRRPIGQEGGLAMIYCDIGARENIDASQVASWIEQSIRTLMRAEDVRVLAITDMGRSSADGIVIERLEIEAASVEIDSIKFSDALLEYEDATVSAEVLVSYESFHILDPGIASGRMIVKAEDLARGVAAKNRDMRDVRVSLDQGLVRIYADVVGLGMELPIEVSGSLRVHEGRLMFDVRSARIAEFNVPGWLLRRAESQINPVIKAGPPRLGLKIRDVSIRPEGIVIDLGADG